MNLSSEYQDFFKYRIFHIIKKRKYRVKLFFLLKSANVALLLRKISVIDRNMRN